MRSPASGAELSRVSLPGQAVALEHLDDTTVAVTARDSATLLLFDAATSDAAGEVQLPGEGSSVVRSPEGVFVRIADQGIHVALDPSGATTNFPADRLAVSPSGEVYAQTGRELSVLDPETFEALSLLELPSGRLVAWSGPATRSCS